MQRLEHDVCGDDLAWPSSSEALSPHRATSNRRQSSVVTIVCDEKGRFTHQNHYTRDAFQSFLKNAFLELVSDFFLKNELTNW